MTMKTFCALIMLLTAFKLNAQVNGYARVTSISSTTISVNSPNETYGTFTAGTQLIIMQMQDNVIGSNTSDNSNFGNLSAISSAGNYEVAVISSVSRTSGVLTQIVINSPFAKTFNTGANSSVQVISYPVLGSGGFTTTADITAVPWNGSTGGVVAFRVNGTLTLNHNISADNAGFQGGLINAGNAGSCDGTVYRIAANDLNANKGEGIYKISNTSYAAGRGKILNGGGGGNSHNAGGGGGSNVSAGGEGGKGFNCSASSGGLGGLTLYSFISSDRVFFGGGGGAGEANNDYTTTGGNGGGIIIIKATQVTTTGTGAALKISANGQNPANVGNDGAGGGGAGGSLLLNVQSWNIASTKTLLISSNGGSGGSVTDATSHGGGGGGGQGAVIYSTGVPTSNITTSTLNGKGGRNYSGGTFAEDAVGPDNQGVYTSSFSLLPMRIVSFKGFSTNKKVQLAWIVANDTEMSPYEVQRSSDGNNYTTIGAIVNRMEHYNFTDEAPLSGTVYYRLKIGEMAYSNVVTIKGKSNSDLNVSIQPNPARDETSLQIYSSKTVTASVRIMNNFGSVVAIRSYKLAMGNNKISMDNLGNLITGNYQLVINSDNSFAATKLMIQK
jgi:hypothetical protein